MKLIKDLGLQYPTEKSTHRARYGIFECPICLKHSTKKFSDIKRSKFDKCRKCTVIIKNTKHGLSNNHKLYHTWKAERNRCNNSNNKAYKNYGGRGITFSDEFNDFSVWVKYVESLDNAYKDTYTIDRIDNDKGYERGNLRWASPNTQARNTRMLMCTNTSGYRGVSKIGKKWGSMITIKKKLLQLGIFATKIEAAQAYNDYIDNNETEHTKNNLAS